MISATGVIMLVLLALVVGYAIGAPLGVIIGLVSTAATKLLSYVRSIGRHVLKCRDRRSRREGDECPITYQA
jgi:hypothetical protein